MPFIELHATSGRRTVLVNLDHVSLIRESDSPPKAELRLVGEATPFVMTVEETYEEVVAEIASLRASPESSPVQETILLAGPATPLPDED
ncbi:MAG: hypothetical protein O6913_03635 [Chloroflexi bacterium]|nr:hypothetical protein [Chloroflexota bacterium]